MKKIIIMTLLLIIFASCSGCGNSIQSSAAPENTPYEIKERYYEVYDITKHGRPAYQYIIFDSNHLAFYNGSTYGFPQVSKSGRIVKLCVKVDKGVFNCRYFHTGTKQSSIWFISPIAENNTLVAYPNQPWGATKLIVQNIFYKPGYPLNKPIYYREFERDFEDRENPVASAEFINGGKQLLITYITKKGDYYKNVTETLDLY